SSPTPRHRNSATVPHDVRAPREARALLLYGPVPDMLSWDLVANAVVAGILLGGFYAAVSLGVSLTFGLLDVVNIAHPAFVILGAYAAYVMNSSLGLDPILTGVLFTPLFYLIGAGVYRIYYASFERRGEESLRGLVFFFGLLFIIEVGLSLKYGVDYRLVEAAYIGKSIDLGGVGIAFRLLVPCVVGLLMTLGLYLFLSRTFYGRAVMGVSQDQGALRLMGADPVRIKTIAFGLGIAAASLSGALLITISPVVPSTDRDYIGRVFAITVLGGLGSIGGTLVAAIILGVAESLMATFFGPSWSLAVSFGILLLALAVRPAGLLGRSGVPPAVPYLVGAAVIAAAFLLAGLRVNPYIYFAGYVVLQYIVIATAWNILGGYAGYVNFGTPAFFALGAYTSIFLIESVKAPLVVLIL